MRWEPGRKHNQFVSRIKFAFFPTRCEDVWVWLERYRENFRWYRISNMHGTMWTKENLTRTPIFGPESDTKMD